MSFVWAEYNQLSELMLQMTAPVFAEATFRCVCSRAYYAAFCSSRDVAQTVDGITVTGLGDDHGIVFRHFKNHQDNDRYAIEMKLRRLRENRNHADYDGTTPVTKAIAEVSIADAKIVLETLAKLRP